MIGEERIWRSVAVLGHSNFRETERLEWFGRGSSGQ
jgi:hypothetical protein